LATKKPPPPI